MTIRQLCWRVPVTHASGEASSVETVVVDYVRIQVTLVGVRSVWVHILNDDASIASAVGAAVCALPTNVAPYVSQTLLLDEVQEMEVRDVDGGGTTTVGMSSSPQSAFSSSLARRLVAKFAPRNEMSVSHRFDVVFTVCCGLHGPLEASLLGTSVSGPSVPMLEFGALVFKSVCAMVSQVLRKDQGNELGA